MNYVSVCIYFKDFGHGLAKGTKVFILKENGVSETAKYVLPVPNTGRRGCCWAEHPSFCLPVKGNATPQ